MVLVGTQLFASDNSGALIVNCIKILGSSFCNHTNVGDKLIVSVRRTLVSHRKLLRKVFKGLLIRQKSVIYRKTGLRFSFFQNSVVLFKKVEQFARFRDIPVGTRIKGVTLIELRHKKYLKLLLLSWKTI